MTPRLGRIGSQYKVWRVDLVNCGRRRGCGGRGEEVGGGGSRASLGMGKDLPCREPSLELCKL